MPGKRKWNCTSTNACCYDGTPYFADTAFSCRMVSGLRLLKDKPDIVALPVGTVSQGKIHESLVGGRDLKQGPAGTKQ